MKQYSYILSTQYLRISSNLQQVFQVTWKMHQGNNKEKREKKETERKINKEKKRKKRGKNNM